LSDGILWESEKKKGNSGASMGEEDHGGDGTRWKRPLGQGKQAASKKKTDTEHAAKLQPEPIRDDSDDGAHRDDAGGDGVDERGSVVAGDGVDERGCGDAGEDGSSNDHSGDRRSGDSGDDRGGCAAALLQPAQS